jgi:hypothetical protein
MARSLQQFNAMVAFQLSKIGGNATIARHSGDEIPTIDVTITK